MNYTSAKPYFYGTGRRKFSIARVRLVPGSGDISINGRNIDDYFGIETLKMIVRQPFAITGTEGKFDIICTVKGGGISGQAGAVRHGVARALLQANEEYRLTLKKAGLLTRDPRISNTQATYMQQSYLSNKDFNRDVFLQKKDISFFVLRFY